MTMKNSLYLALLVLGLFSGLEVKAELPFSRVFSLEGTSSKYGPYEGFLELRKIHNQLSATKRITYSNYSFENLKVEEIWTGKVDSDLTKIEFKIKQADIFSRAEGLVRTPEMFINKIKIVQNLNFDSRSMSFSRNDEAFEEQIIQKIEPDNTPLWEDLRQKQESVGNENSAIINFASKLISLRVFNWFHSQPEVKTYEQREEYKSKKQYFIYDTTDYEFYQKNHHVLRVVNKVPDQISLIEAIQRRNAYAPSLDEKKDHFEQVMQTYHINELGQFSTAQFDNNGNFVRHIMVGDGALWTGMYLASQAMRYKATGEEEALENVKKSLKGLMLLMDITGDEKTFARNAAFDDGTIELNDDYRLGAGIHKNKIWRAMGNNDMFKGLIHGFIWSYIILPDSESELRNELLKHMKQLPKLTIAERRSNTSPAFGLRALATKSENDKKKFIRSFILSDIGRELINIEGNTYVGGIADWSGINLTMVSTLTNIMIAKSILKEMPSKEHLFGKTEKDVYQRSLRSLVLQWKDMATARRDLLTIATYSFAIKDGFDLNEADENDDGLNSDEIQKLWKESFKNCLWGLKEIPINRSKYDISYDYSMKPEWSLSWWPKLPWKSVKEKESVEYHMQGAYAYPLFEATGIGSNFIWKDQPFSYKGGSHKTHKDPPADYLYAYWMARLNNIL